MSGVHCTNAGNAANINFLKLLKVDIVREVRELFHHTVGRHHTLSLRNRVMIVVLWLRSLYSDNACFRNNSILVALFLVYKFPLMPHLCPQNQMVIFANTPESSSFLRMTVILHVVYTYSYDCRFMVKIIPVIRYTISTV
jgi:magnesium-transporting ATPase (P-type)